MTKILEVFGHEKFMTEEECLAHAGRLPSHVIGGVEFWEIPGTTLAISWDGEVMNLATMRKRKWVTVRRRAGVSNPCHLSVTRGVNISLPTGGWRGITKTRAFAEVFVKNPFPEFFTAVTARVRDQLGEMRPTDVAWGTARTSGQSDHIYQFSTAEKCEHYPTLQILVRFESEGDLAPDELKRKTLALQQRVYDGGGMARAFGGLVVQYDRHSLKKMGYTIT